MSARDDLTASLRDVADRVDAGHIISIEHAAKIAACYFRCARFRLAHPPGTFVKGGRVRRGLLVIGDDAFVYVDADAPPRKILDDLTLEDWPDS